MSVLTDEKLGETTARSGHPRWIVPGIPRHISGFRNSPLNRTKELSGSSAADLHNHNCDSVGSHSRAIIFDNAGTGMLHRLDRRAGLNKLIVHFRKRRLFTRDCLYDGRALEGAGVVIRRLCDGVSRKWSIGSVVRVGTERSVHRMNRFGRPLMTS